MGRLVTGEKVQNLSNLKCNIPLSKLSVIDHFVCTNFQRAVFTEL